MTSERSAHAYPAGDADFVHREEYRCKVIHDQGDILCCSSYVTKVSSLVAQLSWVYTLNGQHVLCMRLIGLCPADIPTCIYCSRLLSLSAPCLQLLSIAVIAYGVVPVVESDQQQRCLNLSQVVVNVPNAVDEICCTSHSAVKEEGYVD